jgi:ABC-2 type transport system permease protein
LNLLLGHFLRAMLGGSIAFAAAALAENAASAAIVTLGFTVGTWALDFIAAGRGGFLQQLAAYTPTATLRFFEHGLLRLNILAAMLAISLAGFALTALWLHTGRGWRFRLSGTLALAVLLGFVIVGANTVRASWDASENRRNSFSRADETALKRIQAPLRITIVLAPEDPRLADYEQNVLRKLRRVLPHMELDYASNSRTGLFEKPEDHYGEIWYEMNGQKTMERSTIEEVVLEQIYKLAGVSPPARAEETAASGYPLSASPRGAALIFYGLWPLLTMILWWIWNRSF